MIGESFYEIAFPEVTFSLSGETMVNCPFPHKLPTGQIYYETNPSMGINLDKGVYHCFACGAKGNEIQFIKNLMNVNYKQAQIFKEIFENTTETLEDWKLAEKTLEANPDKKEFLMNNLHFSEKVIKELHIGIEGAGRGFAFPVVLFNRIVDVISYNPGQVPKVKKRVNSHNGFIMPYESWKQNRKHTCIVAGQKDLAIALSNDLNAIAITGGEGELPSLFLEDFRDKYIYIIYDNDETGRTGALNVATALKPYAKLIKIIDLSEVCTGKGEDLWDYFVTYGKTRKDLVNLINETKEFSEEDYEFQKEKEIPTVSLRQATSQEYLNKTLRSNIQILAVDESKFLMPTSAEGKKLFVVGEDASKNKMKINQKLYWNFSETRPKELFYLIDSNLKEKDIKTSLKDFLKVGPELGVQISIVAQEPVYKCIVTDQIDATDLDTIPEEYIAYSITHKLESGKKYKVTYRLIPHPFQGNTLVMVIFNVEESQDSITNFKLNKDVIENLQLFQPKEKDSLEDTIHKHIQKLKGLVNADYDDTLLKLIDFWFNTPLRFNLGNMTDLRAYLDVAIVGESRTGKSTTAQALQKLYGLCTRVPLNGHNASIAGIVGGSQKTKNGYQTRAGVIPRNHKGGIIFEELVKASTDLLKEITEIRSSGWATITRVSGTINLPAMVRMIALTNTRAQGAIPRPITSYPNGIEILLDIIGAPEDVARYDLIGILPGKGAHEIDPFFKPETPYPIEAYRDRIHWIWSRKPEQIIISHDIYTYTIQVANTLNESFNSYIKLFSTETYLKLFRIAIAVAGYTVSTDDSYENIVIKKEHIDYAMNLMIQLYDNDVFRFREFVKAERKFSEVDEEGTKELQRLWQQSQKILLHLENYSKTQAKTLKAVAGIDDTAFNIIMSSLTTNLFIRYEGFDIIPTERFRKTIKVINKSETTRFIRI